MRGAFIGPLGQLVEIAHYKGSIGAAQDRAVEFKRTLGGGKRGFATPNLGLRTWDVNAPMLSPRQYGPFEVMVATSNGPFVFLDPLAQNTNALTPGRALFRSGVTGGTVGGAFTGADGIVHPASLLASSTATTYFGSSTPVLPGVPVTASVYATNGTRVHLHILDAGGAVVSNTSVTAASAGQRVSITVTPPAGAVSARFAVASSNPGTVAGPTLSWTPTVQEWSPGRGAAQVVVHGLSDDIVMASPGQQFKNLSFTVTEVGTGA